MSTPDENVFKAIETIRKYCTEHGTCQNSILERSDLEPGEIFLHFKGKKYKVLTAIAEHTETGEKFV